MNVYAHLQAYGASHSKLDCYIGQQNLRVQLVTHHIEKTAHTFVGSCMAFQEIILNITLV